MFFHRGAPIILVPNRGVWFFSSDNIVRPRRGRGGTLISPFFLEAALADAR